MKILFIAPYSPSETPVPALGAAKKIRLFCGSLSEHASVAFLNTANNCGTQTLFESFFPDRVEKIRIPLLSPRMLGRAVFVAASPLIGLLVGVWVRPQLIWIYNRGAGELLCGHFASLFGAKVVNEVEDAIDARFRGRLELKPKIDRIAEMLVGSSFDYYIFVSKRLSEQYEYLKGPKSIVEGLVSTMSRSAAPEIAKVGYFGGLSPDKGGNLLRSMASELAVGGPVSICGPSSSALLSGSGEVPSPLLKLLSNLADSEVEAEMASCGILLNPHAPLTSMDGVFPFKIVEYVATSAWIVSTELALPSELYRDLGIIIVENNKASFVAAVSRLRDAGIAPCKDILRARAIFLGKYSPSGVVRKIVEEIYA